MSCAFLFPGQGAQYAGMGRDFAEHFAEAREVFEQAEELLGRSITKVMFSGPEEKLKETGNSQVAIYVMSMAVLAVLQAQIPECIPHVCAGFSLGEYSAATAAGCLRFEECLPLVAARGQLMNEACEQTQGSMAAVVGLSTTEVEQAVSALDDVWVANFNCPGQVVISGTKAGIQRAVGHMKEQGARRVLPLKVHGAFHSPLMEGAQAKMRIALESAPLRQSLVGLVMNVTGGVVSDLEEMRRLMAKQITSSVQWETSMETLRETGVTQYFEIGPGTTLSGFIRRAIGAQTISIGKVEDLEAVSHAVAGR